MYHRQFPDIDHKNPNGISYIDSPIAAAHREPTGTPNVEWTLDWKKEKKENINRIRLSPRRGALPERKND